MSFRLPNYSVLTTAVTLLLGWCLVPASSVLPLQPVTQSEPGQSTDSTTADQQPATGSDEFVDQIQPLLEKYCRECHWGDGAEADIDLEKFDSTVTAQADLETWTLMMEVIETDLMPPKDSPRPTDDEVARIKTWLLTITAGLDSDKEPASHIRRLNRTEYENSIQDLLRLRGNVFDNPDQLIFSRDYFQPASRTMPEYVLAMSFDVYIHRKPAELPGITELPNDPPAMHGFNNDQSSLSISPVYLEASFASAQSIVNAKTFSRQTELWDSLFVADSRLDAEQQRRLAWQRLSVFMTRAFRRPVTEQEIDRYWKLFQGELDQSDYSNAMKVTVSAILSSPMFLFRRDHAGDSVENGQVKPYEMASRLSYFLWGTIPDAELYQAAAEGRLTTDADILSQVRRMMKDPKIKNLSTDFGMQWLKLNKLRSARPDPKLFPTWNRGLVYTPPISMMIEQLLLFETILIEDRSIVDFISADFAYLNRVLMDWYQIKPEDLMEFTPPKDTPEDFFRIKWPNTHRGGIISSGAMLASTSATTRTSPVYRGAWILEVVFNQPPPPPPPNVPALNGDGNVASEAANVRDRLAIHRANPTCAVCHDRIDPMGFALEKFDPVGRFRRTYPDGSPIDTTGDIDGDVYDGAARFKNVILRQQDRFVRGFVKHVVRFAIGRQLQITDDPELDRIAADVTKRHHRFSAVIEEVVLSPLFRGGPARVANKSVTLTSSPK